MADTVVASRAGGWRPFLTLCAFAFTLAIALAAVAQPLRAQSDDATQRLLDIKRQQEQGIAPTPPMGPPAASQPGSGQLGTAQTGPASQEGEATVVEAKGVASYYPKDVARSRDEAIEAAQRDAVEQASGVFISTETQMRNFDLVSDEVLSNSKGFIRNYEVTKEGQDGPFYNVFIRATVVKAAFIKNFEDALENLYRRVGKPRIMLVVQEFDSNGGSGDDADKEKPQLDVVEKEIRKILLKEGFTFVDARVSAKGGLSDQERLLTAARTSKAEIVMLGRARIGAKSMLQKFNIVEASVGLDVIRTDNGQVLASDVATGKGLHINEDTAAVTALQKAADEITPKIMQQVSYLWIKEKNEGQRIEMVVKNASFGDLLNLRRALGNTVKGVRKVSQKSYRNGVGMLELESRDPTDRLAESLYETDFGGYKLNIDDVTPTTLTVTLVKTKQQ
ncbi:MAG TPA: hypothetical protein VKB51_09825 [bacterium]|nr:hypothetical protein [bacterium]